jgi:hypothetical protein
MIYRMLRASSLGLSRKASNHEMYLLYYGFCREESRQLTSESAILNRDKNLVFHMAFSRCKLILPRLPPRRGNLTSETILFDNGEYSTEVHAVSFAADIERFLL